MTLDVPNGPVRACSETFDLDGLVARHPEIAERVSRAKAAATAGDLVRRVRERAGLTQAELASRIGDTQDHVIAMERGLDIAWPTIAKLDEIIAKLGDQLVLTTRREEQEEGAAGPAPA